MSFLTRTVLRSKTAPLRLISNPSRPFHLTSARAALSESDHNENERKAKIEHHKEDQINKQKEGKGHWKRELGSNSESAIKADRGEQKDADQDTADLQKQTSSAMQEDHEHGKK